MVALHSRRGQVPGAILLMSLGLVVMTMGGWQLSRLDRTHVRAEALYRVSPQTLLLWLSSLDIRSPDTVERIAERLLLMSLPQRREAVLALTEKEIWKPLAGNPRDLRNWHMVMLQATEGAVAKAPTAGELWFLAGVLKGRLAGFGAVSQRYLALSATYAPREIELVIARLIVLAPAWPLLDNRLKDIVRRDLVLAEIADAGRAKAIRQVLERAGAQLDG
jgi:hypothetical protein